MKRIIIQFLQALIVALGIGALVFMLWEPHLEGRNAQATPFEIYFNDPFLAYAYTASIAFFVALHQAFRLLGYAGQNNVFSLKSLRALRIIKYCATALIALVIAPVAYLFIVRPEDDIAGGVAMGLFLILVSTIIAIASALFERVVQNAVDIKSGNDLTA